MFIDKDRYRMNSKGIKYKLNLTQTRAGKENWKIKFHIERDDLYEILRKKHSDIPPKELTKILDKYQETHLSLRYHLWATNGQYSIKNASSDQKGMITHRYQLNIDHFDLESDHNYVNLNIDNYHKPLAGTKQEKKIRRFIRRILINSFISIVSRHS